MKIGTTGKAPGVRGNVFVSTTRNPATTHPKPSIHDRHRVIAPTLNCTGAGRVVAESLSSNLIFIRVSTARNPKDHLDKAAP